MKKVDEYRLNLSKEMYYFELEQKEKINNRINIVVLLLTLIFGLLAFYFKNLDSIDYSSGWSGLFVLLLILFGSSIFYLIILFFKANFNYEYHYLPKPSLINGKIKEFQDYYNEYYEEYKDYFGNQDKEDLIINEMKSNLVELYSDATEINTELNENKYRYINKMGTMLIISIIIGSFAIIPYHFAHEDKVSEVKIINQSISDEKENGGEDNGR